MKNVYFTVGPSKLYPTVPAHIKNFLRDDIGSLSHRGKAFEEIYSETTQNLRSLLAIPKTHHIFFLSSALEAMERSIANSVHTHSTHLVTGDFGAKFAQTAAELGKKPQIMRFSPDNLSDITEIRIPKQTELLCVTQNETATGIAIPPEMLYLHKKQNPDMLLALDVVSSLPYQKLDFSFVDLVFFSVQKGFGLSAGLGVLIVSPQALEKSRYLQKKGDILGSYHSFPSLLEKEAVHQTPETPNVLAIYLLGKVAADQKAIGMPTIRQKTRERAKMLYQLFDKSSLFTPFVMDPVFRSQTTLVIDTKARTAEILTKLKKKGLIVASGYGKQKTTHIRIANFPSHTDADFNRLKHALAHIS